MEDMHTVQLTSEFGKEWRISMPAVYALLKIEGFPAFRVGRKWLIMREEAREWMLNHPNALAEGVYKQ